MFKTVAFVLLLSVVFYTSDQLRSVLKFDKDALAPAPFWFDLFPQLMGGKAYNTYPRGVPATPIGTLPALPDDINASDADWLEQVQAAIAHRPAVVRGLAYALPQRFGNISKISLQGLKAQYGDREISVFTDMQKDKSAIDMPFSQFAEQMQDKDKMLYARALPDVLGIFGIDTAWVAGHIWGKPFWHWFTKQTCQGEMKGNIPMAFVGGTHVWTQVHCDISSSTFLMVQGRKRWVLYPPTQTRYMYPYAQWRNVAYNAGLDVFAPNFTEVPEFKHAEGFEVTLQQGDVLFFPSMWWHGVQNLDKVTVGVDFPFIDYPGSWARNSVFAVCTLANPIMIYDAITNIFSGGSLRGVFFAGYRKDAKKGFIP